MNFFRNISIWNHVTSLQLIHAVLFILILSAFDFDLRFALYLNWIQNLPEHGDELLAPGGIVVVTAIATETGGDGGVEDTVF